MQRLGLRKEGVTFRITSDGGKAFIPRGHVSEQLHQISLCLWSFILGLFFVCLKFEEKNKHKH